MKKLTLFSVLPLSLWCAGIAFAQTAPTPSPAPTNPTNANAPKPPAMAAQPTAQPSVAPTAQNKLATPSVGLELNDKHEEAIDRIRKNQNTEKLYTWRDKNGVVHVTNTPPPDIIKDPSYIDPTLVTITGQKTQTSKTYTERLKELDEQANKDKEAKSKEQEAKMADAQKKLQCDQLKGRMSLYQSNRSIATVGSDGKENIVASDQRRQTLDTIRSSYDTLCK